MKQNLAIIDFSRDIPKFSCVKVNFEEKEISSAHFVEQFCEFENEEKKLLYCKKLFEKVFYPTPYDIILIFGPNNVASYSEKFFLERISQKSEISNVEMDGFISESVWRMFDKNKQDCAKKFGVAVTDTLLTDIRITEFHLDGKSIVNPIGNLGKKFEASIRQTFVKRSFYEKIINLLPKRVKVLGIYESGAVSSNLIARIADQKDFVLAEIGENRTNLYFKDVKKAEFNDFFNWGEKNLDNVCTEIFGTTQEISKKISESYAAGEFSIELKKKIEKKWNSEMTEFVRGLKSAAVRLKTKNIYINFPVFINTPGLTPEKLFSKILLLGVGADPLKYFGFSCKKCSFNFAMAAAFIENYFLPKGETEDENYSQRTICVLNSFAKRRMKWLMP